MQKLEEVLVCKGQDVTFTQDTQEKGILSLPWHTFLVSKGKLPWKTQQDQDT